MSTQSKHTPGPWRASEHQVLGPVGTFHRVAGGATIDDALLIAAAPDLYAELQAAHDALDSVLTWANLSEVHRRMITERVNAIELLLSKARGQ